MANLSRLSDRKQRLLACALCRRIWEGLTDERSRRSVELAERYADGLASEEELAEASEAAWEVAKVETTLGAITPAAAAAGWAASPWKPGDVMRARHATLTVARLAVQAAVWMRASWKPAEVADQVRAQEEQAQQALLEDVEYPGGKVFDRTSLTPTAVALAQTIYELCSFDRLPELAQVLQDAGWEDVELLDHLRSPGPHAKGCWGLDLVMGKE